MRRMPTRPDVVDQHMRAWSTMADELDLFASQPAQARVQQGRSMADVADFNGSIITEFRANHGRVGGPFDGAPLLLLHTTGARSGGARVNPVMYLRDSSRYVVFGSKAGADSNPAWYYNLLAHPDAQIEVADSILDVHAVEVQGQERDDLYGKQAALYPGFAAYEKKTSRTIPVMALVPADTEPVPTSP
jgi:deazaflavin-dependent oxidoreductase (nitroreductase family)